MNVEDCILSKVDRLVLNGIDIKVKNQVSIDKPHLLEDLLPRKEVVKREAKNLKPRRGAHDKRDDTAFRRIPEHTYDTI